MKSENSVKSEIKNIQVYVDKMQVKGITPMLQQIIEQLAGFMHDFNNRPSEDFEDNLSKEMSRIFDYTFDNDSHVQFNILTSEEINIFAKEGKTAAKKL